MPRRYIPCFGILAVVLVTQQPLHIPAWIIRQLSEAQQRTARTVDEEFHCLRGHGLWVTGIRKPKQTTARKYIEGRRYSTVKHDLCPRGTIADVHSHPRFSGGLKDCKPSATDYATWAEVTAYEYFIITCSPWEPNQVRLEFYKKNQKKSEPD